MDKFTFTMKVIVLIADIISSKKISDRNKIQKALQTELKKINRQSHSLISPMTITLGDEFQCVYSDADEIFRHIWGILLACYPERLRFSYGIGTISTDINRKQAIGMDGPAFYEAREGLSSLKRKDYFFNIRGMEHNSEVSNLIRNTLYFISFNIKNWKKNRVEIMNMLAREFPVKLISQNLNISEQAVYKNIKHGGLQPILDITKNITGIINKMIRE